MEKLPVFKTAWAANKYFFKAFFDKKTFFTFMLPLAVLMLVLGMFADYFFKAKQYSDILNIQTQYEALDKSDENSISFTIGQLVAMKVLPKDQINIWITRRVDQDFDYTSFVAQIPTSIEQTVAQHAENIQKDHMYPVVMAMQDVLATELSQHALVMVIVFILGPLNLMLYLKAACNWHQYLVNNETLSLFKKTKDFWKYVRRVIWYSIIYLLMFAILPMLLVASVGWDILTRAGGGSSLDWASPIVIAIGVVLFVLFLWLGLRVAAMAMALPAAAVGEKLSLRTAVNRANGNLWRFFWVSFLAVFIVSFLRAFFAALVTGGFELTDYSNPLLVPLWFYPFSSFFALWLIFAGLGALTEPYMFFKKKQESDSVQDV